MYLVELKKLMMHEVLVILLKLGAANYNGSTLISTTNSDASITLDGVSTKL